MLELHMSTDHSGCGTDAQMSGGVCRQRKAVEDQISHFGQTPSQLFRRKHPKRGPPPLPSFHPLLNGPDAMKLSLVGMPPSRR